MPSNPRPVWVSPENSRTPIRSAPYYEIIPDPDPQNPRDEVEWLGMMWCFHKKYQLGDKHPLHHNSFDSWDAMEQHIRTAHSAVAILPVYLMDHSGLSVSTTSFNDRWDSGQVGFIWASKESIQRLWGDEPLDPTKLNELLRHEVAVYDTYLRGDVWGYVIYRDGVELERCYGFLGHEEAEQEAKAQLGDWV